eukprot:scaffold68194_cov58-Attheya_sp.AAC.7
MEETSHTVEASQATQGTVTTVEGIPHNIQPATEAIEIDFTKIQAATSRKEPKPSDTSKAASETVSNDESILSIDLLAAPTKNEAEEDAVFNSLVEEKASAQTSLRRPSTRSQTIQSKIEKVVYNDSSSINSSDDSSSSSESASNSSDDDEMSNSNGFANDSLTVQSESGMADNRKRHSTKTSSFYSDQVTEKRDDESDSEEDDDHRKKT